jgi:uncharacterized membrane protein
MRVWGHRLSGQYLFTPASILALAVFLVVLPPDGIERTEWMQFIGRFHPLAVHFPIALILLVPVLELAGLTYRFTYLHLSAGFVLGLATFAATLAAILGWCLARSGGYSGPLVTQHMWGGVSLAAVCWLCWILRASVYDRRGAGAVYAVALLVSVALVSWTGYRGGQLTLGQDHLTKFMPESLRQRLGVANDDSATSIADPNTFYGARIQPVFAERCIKCHGKDKQKGNLRLDSFRSLMRGGKHGVVVRAGSAEQSDLIRRITLPPDSDDFMPKEGKRPLSADQVKAIELWIASGASDTLPREAIKDAPAGSAPATVTEVSFEEIDPTAVAKLRAEIAPAVGELQKRFPNILDYESRGSADLVLNASILGPKFGDNDIAALTPLAGHITEADFSRTAITDRSANALAGMKRLRILRLTSTKITDTTVRELGTLDRLESLNVFGAPVTPAALPMVAKLPKLEHLYVGQTGIPAGSSIPQSLTGKVVF